MMRETPASRPTLVFAGTVVALLATFRVLDVAIARLGALPASAYRDPVFLPHLVGRWWQLVASRVPWWALVALVLLGAAAVVADQRMLKGAVWQR
ncbi:MAG TPA: hypothetical protein VM076_11160, partial [Gemmatimonadaceae bacterium]|nr:hypothetical protein [Gemmatimonadaceae bacterium]